MQVESVWRGEINYSPSLTPGVEGVEIGLLVLPFVLLKERFRFRFEVERVEGFGVPGVPGVPIGVPGVEEVLGGLLEPKPNLRRVEIGNLVRHVAQTGMG